MRCGLSDIDPLPSRKVTVSLVSPLSSRRLPIELVLCVPLAAGKPAGTALAVNDPRDEEQTSRDRPRFARLGWNERALAGPGRPDRAAVPDSRGGARTRGAAARTAVDAARGVDARAALRGAIARRSGLHERHDRLAGLAGAPGVLPGKARGARGARRTDARRPGSPSRALPGGSPDRSADLSGRRPRGR